MIKPLTILISLVFLQGYMTPSEFVEHCHWQKGQFTSEDEKRSAELTLQPKLPAPQSKINYWTISEFDRNLVIPVDDYKKIIFLPNNDMENFTIVLEGSIYKVELGGALSEAINAGPLPNTDHLYNLTLGINTKLSDVTCSIDSAKNDNKALLGIGLKTSMLWGIGNLKSLSVSDLDSSNKGWLFVGNGSSNGIQWYSLLVSPQNLAFEYSITKSDASDSKQMAGLLSQSQEYLFSHSVKQAPNWLSNLEGVFDKSFDSLRDTITPIMENNGFIPVEMDGLSMLVFEK